MSKQILENIESAEDVQSLSIKEMEQLCAEVRDFLIHCVSQNGGHLASNLGVVELTVALHNVFTSPTDQIVWDVGHQSYTHKILTGRAEAFSTLRKKGGLSGFPKPAESPHDAFIAGHSSTSISAAFGLAEAKRIKGDPGYVIAVIGDGALTGGMAYEALNNAGRSRDRLIVILNDNKMSISENVGAIARYLAVIRSGLGYVRFKMMLERLLKRIPLIGKPICRVLIRSKSAIKNSIYHSNWFDEMGFAYLGPLDGHDLSKLIMALKAAKKMRRPVLIHINTVKGKGYEFAEKKPHDYHGVSGFDVSTGDCGRKGDSFSEEFGQALVDLAGKDDRICAITAAMTEGTGLAGFRKKFKNRFFDVGIAEEHAVTFGAGLAVSGMLPVFAVYSSFLQRSVDQIIHDAAILNTNLVLAIDRAGIVGEDGETHQGVFDVALLNAVPNITIYSPSTYAQLRADLKQVLYKNRGLCAVRYPRGAQGAYSIAFESPFCVMGKSDVALITYGRLCHTAIQVKEELEREGVFVQVVCLNRIKPIDPKAIEAVIGCGHVRFAEEGIRSGGIGEHFGALLLDAGFQGRYHIRAVPDCFLGQATVSESLEECGLDASSLKKWLQEAKGNE